MKPSNTLLQDLSSTVPVAMQDDLHKELICLDLLLAYCQMELKTNRRRAYRRAQPDDTLVHSMLVQAGHAARKPGIIHPFMGIGFFLLLALFFLPITLCFQTIYWFFNKGCHFADWRRDNRQIQKLRTAIQGHDCACGNIHSLWRKFSPSDVGLSRYEGQSLLATWLSNLYGENSRYWAQKLDAALERQTRTLVRNHAEFSLGESKIRLMGHPTPWSALRALNDEIPVRYRDSPSQE